MNRYLVDVVQVRIGKHKYKSKFVLGGTRYDVILETPRHKDVKPMADYDNYVFRIGDAIITRKKCEPEGNDLSDISIRGFRRMLKTKVTQVFA